MLDAPRLGPTKVFDLLRRFGSASAAIAHLSTDPTVGDAIRAHFESRAVGEYQAQLYETADLGGDFKLWTDPDYPANLGLWAARPPILFFRGDLSHLGTRSLALVGRVDPTTTGIEEARRFGRKCVESEITIVSGLAKGIDAASHRAALETPDGFTYAVVGHGLAHSYPPENADLYAEIPQRGAIISQFPLHLGPQKWTFPARNEVMCTVALGTVIIEGKTGCGSIIQADFSFKHGRPVFLLSRNLGLPDNEWALRLVDRGAHVIERFDDVTRVLERVHRDLWSPPPGSGPLQETLELFLGEGTDTPPPATPHSHSQAVLFDLDGVIIDSRAATTAALAAIATRHTGRDVSPADVTQTGSPTAILSALGVQSAKDVYKAEYDREFQAHRESIAIIDEVAAGIRELRAAGVRVGAVTSQPRRRISVMLPSAIEALFEELLTYNDTRGSKSTGIAMALRTFGISPEHALFIGDQVSDLNAARDANVKGVGVAWGFEEASQLEKAVHVAILRDPSEVGPNLVTRLLPT